MNLLILFLHFMFNKPKHNALQKLNGNNTNINLDTNNDKESKQAERAFYCFNYSEKRELTDIEDKTKNKLVTKVKNIIHDKNLKIIDLNNPAYIKKIAKDDIEYSEWKYNKRDMGFVFVYRNQVNFSFNNNKFYQQSTIMQYVDGMDTPNTVSLIDLKTILNNYIILKICLKKEVNINDYGGFIDKDGINTLIIKIWIKNKIEAKDIKITGASDTEITTSYTDIIIDKQKFNVTKLEVFSNANSNFKNENTNPMLGIMIKLTLYDPLISLYSADETTNPNDEKVQFKAIKKMSWPERSFFVNLFFHDTNSKFESTYETFATKWGLISRRIEKGKEVQKIDNYIIYRAGLFFFSFKDYLDNYKYYVLQINAINVEKRNSKKQKLLPQPKITISTYEEIYICLPWYIVIHQYVKVNIAN